MRNLSRPGSVQRGLTLIEVLMVLALVAILMGLTISGYLSYQRSVQLNEMAQKTISIIRDTGDKSLTRSSQFKLTSSTGSKQIVWKDSSNAVLQTLNLNPVEVSSWPGDVVFQSRGLPTQQYKISLKNANKTKDIYILTTGKVIVR